MEPSEPFRPFLSASTFQHSSGSGSPPAVSNVVPGIGSGAGVGPKLILFVRHTEDAKPPRTRCHTRWNCEHNQHEGPVQDPCLTPAGCVDAVRKPRGLIRGHDGVNCHLEPPSLQNESNPVDSLIFPFSAPVSPITDDGNSSVSVGHHLPSFVLEYSPTMVVSSPLRRAFQMVGLTFEGFPLTAPIVLHPAISAKNKKGKPENRGVPVSRLRSVLQHVPRGNEMDLSLLGGEDGGDWCPFSETEEDFVRRVSEFVPWLQRQTEHSVICVVAHGSVIQHLARLPKAPTHGGVVLCLLNHGVLSAGYIPPEHVVLTTSPRLPVEGCDAYSPLTPSSPQHVAPSATASFCFVQTLSYKAGSGENSVAPSAEASPARLLEGAANSFSNPANCPPSAEPSTTPLLPPDTSSPASQSSSSSDFTSIINVPSFDHHPSGATYRPPEKSQSGSSLTPPLPPSSGNPSLSTHLVERLNLCSPNGPAQSSNQIPHNTSNSGGDNHTPATSPSPHNQSHSHTRTSHSVPAHAKSPDLALDFTNAAPVTATHTPKTMPANPPVTPPSPLDAFASLCVFAGQVSGRHLMFNTPEGVLYKEADEKEVAFYTSMAKERDSPLHGFLAEFYCVERISGAVLLRAKQDVVLACDAAMTPCATARKTLRNFAPREEKTYHFVALRDVTHGLVRPCVVDIKMGRTQYEVGAPQTKVLSKERKARETTSRNLFFRICGMKVFKSPENGYSTHQKEVTERLTKFQMQAAFEDFLNNGYGLRYNVLHNILRRLRALRRVFETQTFWRFRTSSLLLVYDGDNAQEGDSPSTSSGTICMVDFAHVEQDVGVIDIEYVYALSNLIDVLDSIAKGQPYQPPSTPRTMQDVRCTLSMIRSRSAPGFVDALAKGQCSPQSSPTHNDFVHTSFPSLTGSSQLSSSSPSDEPTS